MVSRESQKIGSITTFIARLEDLKLDKPSNDVYFFRGHPDYIKYKLKPSIYRELEWIRNEHRMFREIIMKCPDDFTNTKTAFEKLVKMQHYSFPTRLLDLTGNPLAALFFAVNENPDKDGEVLIFKIPKKDVKYYDSDTVSVLSNISKRPSDFDISNIKNKNIEEFNEDTQIKYLIHEIKEEKPYFESKIIASEVESVVCVKPKLDNPRIIKQDGAFFLFGISNNKNQSAKIPEKYKVTSESYRLIINKSGKQKILGQLATLGISEATLFPEIDSVSKYLKANIKNEAVTHIQRKNKTI